MESISDEAGTWGTSWGTPSRMLLYFNESANATGFENATMFILDPGGLSDEDDIICHPYHTYLDFLHTYYIPLVIAVGLVGNFLSFVVFLTTPLKTRSSSYYLAALSMADFGFLSVLLLVHCSFNGILDIYNKDWWCQTFVYVSSVCANLSVWLVVAFTVERFIAVQYPLQRPQICTVSRAKAVVLVLTLIVMVTQTYLFAVAGVINLDGVTEECEMKPDYHEFMKVVNVIDTFATLILPFVLIVFMNTMIARNLFMFSKRLQSRSVDECLYDDSENTELQRTQTQSASSRRTASQAPSLNSNKSAQSKIGKRMNNSVIAEVACIQIRMSARNVISPKCQRNITKMLVLIDSVFIVLNFPSYSIRVYVFFAYNLWQKTPPDILWCSQQFAMLLYYTNFSINFLLYAMCGITFRRRLWQLVRNKLKRISRKPCQVQ